MYKMSKLFLNVKILKNVLLLPIQDPKSCTNICNRIAWVDYVQRRPARLEMDSQRRRSWELSRDLPIREIIF